MPTRLRSLLGNGALARAQLSFGAAAVAEFAFTVALALVAYADGGAAAVGLVGVLRLVPAAGLAPVVGVLADRRPRDQVLLASSLLRGVATLTAAAVLAAGGPHALVYLLATVSTIAFTPFRAAHSALLPSLCREPDELAQSNVVRGGLDSLSVMAGPLIAAALVAIADVWTVLAFAGLAALGSAALVAGLEYERVLRPADGPPSDLRAEVRTGLRGIRDDREVRLIVGLATLQLFTRGALGVFVVVVAIDLLGLGESGVGLLQGASGVGAVLGSIGAARLVGSPAMARWFGAAVAAWGLPLVLLGALPGEAVAVLALAVIGMGNAVVDVAAFTALGRMIPDAVLARVFGVMESALALAVALGALVTPGLIDLLGVEAALVLTGLVAPTGVALRWAALRRIDGGLTTRGADIGLLRRVAMLRPLPVPVVEQLARGLQRSTVAAGEAVFRAGDAGDRFYVIEQGAVRVLDGGKEVRRMGPGEGFGEIALLRDVPRTMTVCASEDVTLGALSRGDFLAAVTGFGSSAREASTSVSGYLARDAGAAP